MFEISTVLDVPRAAAASALPRLVPELTRSGEAFILELKRRTLAELAARPVNSARLGRASGRWYPAFAGRVTLDELSGDRTQMKIEGIVIPGMGPIEDERWERRVAHDAVSELAHILQGHFSHNPVHQ